MADYQKAANVSQIVGVVIGAVMLWIMVRGVPDFLKAESSTATPQASGKMEYVIPSLFVLGLIGAAGLNVYAARVSHRPRQLPPPPSASEWRDEVDDDHPIIGQTFRNENVELDGRRYDRCIFENVSFFFHGKRSFHLVNSEIRGTRVIRSDNAAVIATAALMVGLGVTTPNFHLDPSLNVEPLKARKPPSTEPEA